MVLASPNRDLKKATRLNASRLIPLGISLLAALAANALEVGDTYEQVLEDKGPPASQAQAGANRILRYPSLTVRLKNDIVVSIDGPAGVRPPATEAVQNHPLTAAEQIAADRVLIRVSTEKIKRIVNQPARSVPIAPGMSVTNYGDAWFHPGAMKPDFNNVDVRKTRQAAYARFAYVSSNMTPGIAFPGSELEFNPVTKYFYTDRTVPKKKLTEAEMVEINRLYRILGRCEEELSRLGGG
jgi:hypothetical protein